LLFHQVLSSDFRAVLFSVLRRNPRGGAFGEPTSGERWTVLKRLMELLLLRRIMRRFRGPK
jgi:hypothetical protein